MIEQMRTPTAQELQEMIGSGPSPYRVKIAPEHGGYFVYWQDANEQPPYWLHHGWHLDGCYLTRWGARWKARRLLARLTSPTGGVEYITPENTRG